MTSVFDGDLFGQVVRYALADFCLSECPSRSRAFSTLMRRAKKKPAKASRLLAEILAFGAAAFVVALVVTARLVASNMLLRVTATAPLWPTTDCCPSPSKSQLESWVEPGLANADAVYYGADGRCFRVQITDGRRGYFCEDGRLSFSSEATLYLQEELW